MRHKNREKRRQIVTQHKPGMTKEMQIATGISDWWEISVQDPTQTPAQGRLSCVPSPHLHPWVQSWWCQCSRCWDLAQIVSHNLGCRVKGGVGCWPEPKQAFVNCYFYFTPPKNTPDPWKTLKAKLMPEQRQLPHKPSAGSWSFPTIN